MQIVPSGQPLRQPNICLICEAWSGPESGVSMIDTLRDFEVGVITKLSGRKYVCSSCGDEIARTLGYVAGAEHADTLLELEERTLRLNRLEATSNALGQAQALQSMLAALLPDVDSLAQDEADADPLELQVAADA